VSPLASVQENVKKGGDGNKINGFIYVGVLLMCSLSERLFFWCFSKLLKSLL